MNLSQKKLNLQYSLFLLFIFISCFSALKPTWKTAPRDGKNNISLIVSRSQRASNPSLIRSKPGPPSYYTLPENFQIPDYRQSGPVEIPKNQPTQVPPPVPPPFHSFFPNRPFNRPYPSLARNPPARYVPIPQVPIAPYPPLYEVTERYSTPSTTVEPSREPSAPSATPKGYFEETVTVPTTIFISEMRTSSTLPSTTKKIESTTQPKNDLYEPEIIQTSSPTPSYQLELNPKDFPDQTPYPEPIPASQVYTYSEPTRPSVSTSGPYYPRPVHEQPYAPDPSRIPPTNLQLAPPKCLNYVCETDREQVSIYKPISDLDHPPTIVISTTAKEQTPNQSPYLEDITPSPFETNPYEEVTKTDTHPPGGLVYPPPLELTTRRNVDQPGDSEPQIPTAPRLQVIEIVTNGPYGVPETPSATPSVLTPSPTIPQRVNNPYGLPEPPATTAAPPRVPVATRRIPDAYRPPEGPTAPPPASKAPGRGQEGPYGGPADDITTKLPTTVKKRIEYQTESPKIELRTEAHPPSSSQIPSHPPSIRPAVTDQTEILYEYLGTTPPNAEDVTLSNDVPTRFTYSPPLIEYLETTTSKFPSVGDDFPRNQDDKHEDLTPDREMIETTQEFPSPPPKRISAGSPAFPPPSEYLPPSPQPDYSSEQPFETSTPKIHQVESTVPAYTPAPPLDRVTTPKVINNRIRGQAQVVCLPNGVLFSIHTVFPFKGQIFASNRETTPSCQKRFDDEKEASIFLAYEECGIRNSVENPLESKYHLEIVVMINQPNGTTDLQTFMAQCEQQRVYYNKQKLPKRIEEALEELHLVASRIEQKALIPQVEMKIFIDEHHELGAEASTAELGTHLAVQWKLFPESDAYGFHVRNCVVRDSFNGIDHQIIDPHGCSTDLQILTHPHYDTYHDQAAAKLWAFKIPDHSTLSIRCDVLICSDIPSTKTNVSSCATVPTPPFCPDLITSAPNSIAFDFGKSNRKRESLGEFTEEDMISASRTISVKAAYCIGEECKNKPKERHPYCVDVWWASVSSGFTLSAFALSFTVNTVVRFTKRD